MFATESEKIQFGCVFAAFLLWVITLFPLYHSRSRSDGNYNHNTPRATTAGVVADRDHRAVGTHLNQFEAFTLFTLAVYFNRFGAGSHRGANILCIIFVAARAFYIIAYLWGKGAVRTFFWTIGFLATFVLFILPFATNY
ncbi:hypothetical protein IWQ60_005021 [Tieghemiomyces parasiticus]|uniref:MAPEG family protein n=1 Tax=Tieghemiomyces parasiticus TaxID=78921 RepID=A0A9W8A6T1_9FUNG|nr:hypothetical protein IWQ60_005021 [Tieghemiomyces parasiticus]